MSKKIGKKRGRLSPHIDELKAELFNADISLARASFILEPDMSFYPLEDYMLPEMLRAMGLSLTLIDKSIARRYRMEKLQRKSSPPFRASALEAGLRGAGLRESETAKSTAYLRLDALNERLKNTTLCFVDIESTGHSPHEHDLIDIGAIKVRDGVIVDELKTLVYAKDIPEHISELTRISPAMLEGAPSIEQALLDFKVFLDDSIFVAHGVDFDYDFLSSLLYDHDLGHLANLKLDSLELARHLITGPKYSIAYLNKAYKIGIDDMHRAYNDALVLASAFKELCHNLGDITLRELYDIQSGIARVEKVDLGYHEEDGGILCNKAMSAL